MAFFREFAAIQNVDDVGVTDAREYRPLFREQIERGLVGLPQSLEGNIAFGRYVIGSINDAHPALTQRVLDLVPVVHEHFGILA